MRAGRLGSLRRRFRRGISPAPAESPLRMSLPATRRRPPCPVDTASRTLHDRAPHLHWTPSGARTSRPRRASLHAPDTPPDNLRAALGRRRTLAARGLSARFTPSDPYPAIREAVAGARTDEPAGGALLAPIEDHQEVWAAASPTSGAGKHGWRSPRPRTSTTGSTRRSGSRSSSRPTDGEWSATVAGSGFGPTAPGTCRSRSLRWC